LADGTLRAAPAPPCHPVVIFSTASRDTRFRGGFAGPDAAQCLTRNHARVIDLPDIFAVAIMLLTGALFAAMIWAGNHRH
jgi:hypothetical protein